MKSYGENKLESIFRGRVFQWKNIFNNAEKVLALDRAWACFIRWSKLSKTLIRLIRKFLWKPKSISRRFHAKYEKGTRTIAIVQPDTSKVYSKFPREAMSRHASRAGTIRICSGRKAGAHKLPKPQLAGRCWRPTLMQSSLSETW